MKFAKDQDRKKTVFQKENKTMFVVRIVILILVILAGAIIASGIHFNWL